MEEEQAQISQRLEIEKIKATSDAEAARAREDGLTASEEARIGRERQTSVMEVSKRSELRKIEIDSQLNLELKKVDSAIQLAAKHVEEARAQAQAELARSEVIQAQERVQTDRELAMAARSHQLALKRVEEEGNVESAKAETAASTLLRRIRAESEAMNSKAEAERLRMLAQSEGERALIDAENTRSESLNRLKLEQYRLDKLPVIVAEMMKPAEKIDSIRIHQISGLGGAPGTTTNADLGKPPVNQVMDSILSMALQLPALRSIGDSIGLDFSSAVSPSSGTRVEAEPSPPKRSPK
jgi:flotillin